MADLVTSGRLPDVYTFPLWLFFFLGQCCISLASFLCLRGGYVAVLFSFCGNVRFPDLRYCWPAFIALVCTFSRLIAFLFLLICELQASSGASLF
jgi:hypothetical protein